MKDIVSNDPDRKVLSLKTGEKLDINAAHQKYGNDALNYFESYTPEEFDREFGELLGPQQAKANTADIHAPMNGCGARTQIQTHVSAIPRPSPAQYARADDSKEAKPDFDAEVARLAEISQVEYDRQRKDAAKRLGVRVKVLDKAVEDQRKAKEEAEAEAEKPKSRMLVAMPNVGVSRPRGMFTPVEVGYWPSVSLIGNPHGNDIRNVEAALHAAGVRLRYDAFTGQSVATCFGKNTVIDDGVCQRFWTMLQNSDLRAAYAFTCEAITALSRETTFDSAIDFFTNLPKWDGITRAETLLIDELGAEDTPYTRGATRLFFASLVRRGMGLESKCDEFIILRGPQGLGSLRCSSSWSVRSCFRKT